MDVTVNPQHRRGNHPALCVWGKFWLTDISPREASISIIPKTGDRVSVIIFDNELNGSSSDHAMQSTRVNAVCFPNNIGQLHQFSRMILQRSTDSIVVCVGPGPRNLSHAAFLLGGYLIVCEKMGMASVQSAFIPVISRLVALCPDYQGHNAFELMLVDCWSAVHRATELGWLDFSDEPSEESIDMEEHLHYASVTNGELHVVVPNKLLAFRAPTDLPEGYAWMDDNGARRFSPSYYADILPDFDVSVVLCCGGAGSDPPYDASTLEARGMGVEVLATDVQSRRLLAAADRVLTLARAAPGAIALHGMGGGEEDLLLTSYLIRLHGFPARQAIAWAHMAHPAAHSAPEFKYCL